MSTPSVVDVAPSEADPLPPFDAQEAPLPGEGPLTSLGEVLSRPKRFLTRACQLLVARHKGLRPKQPTRMLNRKKGTDRGNQRLNVKSPRRSETKERREAATATPTHELLKNVDVTEKCEEEEVEDGQKADALAKAACHISQSDDLFSDRREVPSPRSRSRCTATPSTCCLCCAREATMRMECLPPVLPMECPVNTLPVVSFAAGRYSGRGFVPSGGIHLYSSPPKRHAQLIAVREDSPEARPNVVRATTPISYVAGLSRMPSQPGRVIEATRPRGGLSPSSSSPLTRGPVRIHDRHDVLTPDTFFDQEHQPSPPPETLFDPEPPENIAIGGETQEEIGKIGEYEQQVLDLQLELELLRTETERQRKEREKYQKLYESTALCQICMEKRRNSFILPCSHFVYCVECLERHWEVNNFKQCPMCRGPAHSVIITNLGC